MIARKCVVQGERWQSWSQPILSANGTLGGLSFAVAASSEGGSYAAYKAFDNADTSWRSTGCINNYMIFYNPIKLKVSSISVLNRRTELDHHTESNYAMPAGSVYGSNDGTTWYKLCDFTNSVQASNTRWTINVSAASGYKYHKILCTANNSNGLIRVHEYDIVALALALA